MSELTINQLLQDIEEVSQLLCDRGWAEKNAGNLSVDVTEIISKYQKIKDEDIIRLESRFEYLGKRIFLITPSGSRFRDIARWAKEILMLIKINENGDGYFVIANKNKKPTSELKTHLRIHNYLRKINSESRVVLHTHPTDLIAISHIRELQSSERLNNILISAHPEVYINLSGRIGFVKYILTGSDRLADATLNCVKKGKSLLIWERHGALSIEKDVISAFDNLDIANKAAEIVLKLFACRKKPIRLSKKELKELDSLRVV